MTHAEFKSAYEVAAAAININIVTSETDFTHIQEFCCYGGKYDRGISESFWDFSQDVNHPAKLNILIKELNSKGIKTQPPT